MICREVCNYGAWRNITCSSMWNPVTNLISVIIPCYQQGRFLHDAVSSLQAQTYTNWEAIIVNDGSLDETASVARFLCDTDSRVQYLGKHNGGLSSARNAGLALAKGDWIQFLDADDLLLPQKFEKQIAAAADNSKDTLIYCDYFLGACDEPTRRLDPRSPDHEFRMSRPLLDMAMRWENELSIPIHAALFPAWLFRNEQLRFDESLPNHEDWDMWMQVLVRVEKVCFVRDELVIYRMCPNSMCTDWSRMWLGFAAAINKQKQCFLHDPEVMRGLEYLAAMNDYIHRRGVRGRLRSLVDNATLPRWLWPLKGIVQRSIRPPRRPNGVC